MKFDVSFFTHVGTDRKTNQDRILVQDHIFQDGLNFLPNTTTCFCYVADGIGGSPAGDVAAQFVLEKICQRFDRTKEWSLELIMNLFMSINSELIQFGATNPQYRGMGTTLVGLIINDAQLILLNAGDSEAWLFRNEIFFKLTEDQVLIPGVPNSPITSYFGGIDDELHIQFVEGLRNFLSGDIFVLASDGLFKSISPKQVKAILSNNTPVVEKANFILARALENKSEDNVSCILIEVV